VVINDTLPGGVYYSIALDSGSGPEPGSVVANADGTTTLQWTIGALLANTAPRNITYTARPGLLFLEGEEVANSAVLEFTDKNGCDFPAVNATAHPSLSRAAITKHRSRGYYKNHPGTWTTGDPGKDPGHRHPVRRCRWEYAGWDPDD
jgi:hypothetical protein